MKRQRQGRTPERARKLLPLCHTEVSAPKNLSKGAGECGIDTPAGVCGRITECNILQENTEVEVLPVVDLIADAFFVFIKR